MEKLLEVWERTNLGNPFADPESILIGIFTEESAKRFLTGKKIVERYDYDQGFYTRDVNIIR